MPARQEQIKKAYRISKLYDKAMTGKPLWARIGSWIIWGFHDLAYTSSVLRFIPDNFAGRLLDVPVGTATFTCRKYAEITKAEITAIDYSEEMLTLADRHFKDLGLCNITCMQGDVGNLPFENETFDTVLSMNGFHVFPDKEKAFSETIRVLKTGGTFCGCFYVCGVSRRTDWFIKTFFVPKGWFTPPFYTKVEVEKILKKSYRSVEINDELSIVYFRCTK